MSLMTFALLLQWSELSLYFIWPNNNIWHSWSFSLLERIYMSFCIPSVLVFSSYITVCSFQFPYWFFFPSRSPKYCSAHGLSPWSFSLFYSIYIHFLVILSLCISDDSQNLHFCSILRHTTNCVLNFSIGLSNWQIDLKFWNNTSILTFNKNREVVKINIKRTC